ncbi:hypothetical protein PQ462_21145 [Flavobacterium sp. KACC 22758]|jgi:hypothetical protein|uniref:hypothetical protein n=1 Tax=Flavobacterium sp. KACC 22758 TaxID=3025667 RepID=UPI002366C566|nr:hypothetical protein [Flavobacterium sp. KACC 22758]WDF59209.1 hypothetical protein PQ462_21145 [Flavobacterium sp. KACC 22758]
MSIPTNQCTVFVQVWADVNSLKQGSTNGCYAVSNKSQQSTGEGSANLTTKVITGSNVCWSVLPIDPQFANEFAITQVGAQSGWATPPAPVPGSPNMFTGQLTTSTVGGNVNSNIVFSYIGGGQSITVTLPVTIIPVTA